MEKSVSIGTFVKDSPSEHLHASLLISCRVLFLLIPEGRTGIPVKVNQVKFHSPYVVVDIFPRVTVGAFITYKSETWNFHPESDKEPLKVFLKKKGGKIDLMAICQKH